MVTTTILIIKNNNLIISLTIKILRKNNCVKYEMKTNETNVKGHISLFRIITIY